MNILHSSARLRSSPSMKLQPWLLALALFPVLGAPTAHAFFEEGNDSTLRLGYLKCSKQGDLKAANKNGCNPWYDSDGNYSYKSKADIKKSSLHFNMTAALAAAAGFDRCTAYVIALYAEATDVATGYDQDFWAPLPSGLTEASCSDLFRVEGVSFATGLNGVKGALISPDFTFRSFSLRNDNEIQRESWTFHWNKTYTSLTDRSSLVCHVTNTDPVPASPNRDHLTMWDLKRWVDGENTLHSCKYADGSVGPIKNYDPDEDGVDPGSPAALGVFMHSFQDTFSHRGCNDTTHNFGLAVSNPCGFSSGHYAGEYGTLANGKIGTGSVDVKTPAGTYSVIMHSNITAEAITESYKVLKDYLAEHPEYSRGKVACPEEAIAAMAEKFAAIPNTAVSGGSPSGARKRSDYADGLFASESCLP